MLTPVLLSFYLITERKPFDNETWYNYFSLGGKYGSFIQAIMD